jgi:uncharacterized protein YceK
MQRWRMVRRGSNSLEGVEMKRRMAMSLLIIALVGCASTRESDRGPNGRPVYYVEGKTVWSAYNKADAQCQSGYYMIGGDLQPSVLDYVMAVECR